MLMTSVGKSTGRPSTTSWWERSFETASEDDVDALVTDDVDVLGDGSTLLSWSSDEQSEYRVFSTGTLTRRSVGLLLWGGLY